MMVWHLRAMLSLSDQLALPIDWNILFHLLLHLPEQRLSISFAPKYGLEETDGYIGISDIEQSLAIISKKSLVILQVRKFSVWLACSIM